MFRAGVYLIKCYGNNKSYIGKSKYTWERVLDHVRELKKNKHVNSHMQRAFNKYGISTFEYTVIEPIEDIKICGIRENELIMLFGRCNLFNKTDGGESGCGGTRSLEQKENLRQKNLGKKYSAEVNASKGRKGHAVSEETRAKLSKSNTGKTGHIDLKQCKQIQATNKLTGEVKMYKSIMDASRYGFDRAGIKRALSGQHSQCRGYVWKYLN